MHASFHTFAQRAPPASRARARWQPYNSLSTYSTTSASSSSSCGSSTPGSTSTPATSIGSPNQTTPACDSACDKPQITSPPSECSLSSKNKFALGLVDQACKTLSEVWRPQDIPTAFCNPRTTTKAAELAAKLQIPDYQTLLANKRRPSATAPTSPTASTSIPTKPSVYSFPSPSAPPVLIQPGTSSELRNLVPVRGFVHEVLKRSRTSGCVLQTALCYLEAIRPKIRELAHLEQIGQGTDGEPESGRSRIIVASEEEIERSKQQEAMEMAYEASHATRFGEDSCDNESMDTLRIDDNAGNCFSAPEGPSMTQHQWETNGSSCVEETESNHSFWVQSTVASGTTASIPVPLPRLPSPLLCPRRAFLAALILASKFTQDKCYSNRAWAKLSGLAPREIGRCERALGSALEWRLWVGKAACSPSPVVPQRPVARCQSEPSINFAAPVPVPSPATDSFMPHFAGSDSSAVRPETPSASVVNNQVGSGNRRAVRRASTMPANFFDPLMSQSTPHAVQFCPQQSEESMVYSSEPSSTLVLSEGHEGIPSINVNAVFRSAPTSLSGVSPSPEMPGLSYSPSSSASSDSDSPSCCSTTSDRSQQLNVFFEDASGQNEYFNSPVAIVNTQLLVPGYVANGLDGVQKAAPAPLGFGFDVRVPPSVSFYGTRAF